MKKISAVIAVVTALSFSGPVVAAEAQISEKQALANIKARLKTVAPEVKDAAVKKSPVPGVYEVILDLRQYYITADGRYLIPDGIVDLDSEGELSKANLNKAIANSVTAVGDANMVIFGKKKAKHTVTVFTDIDCGYCRKLHSEMAGYNKEGIRIRYLFYPRAGMVSPSYQKAVAVWCDENRNKAMTQAKAGEELKPVDCDNPVQDHMLLGKRIGISGTPAMILENGEVLPGYVPPKKLAAFLNERAKQK